LTQSRPIEAAYAACRAIAKREAKNFYYAFVALPAHKRDAMCAIYAFMRHADDISDDESKDHATRRIELAQWTEAWRNGADTSDPVFVAVRDTQQRFDIPDELLEQLIQGTAMDLEPEAANRRGADGLDTFATFTDLYRYCYYVASIVGLVCIRIFGYSNPAAERLAEETGVAFQLTNILRDVREDRENGRIYIPEEDIRKFGADLAKHDERFVRLMSFEAQRARAYYDESRPLIALVHPRSRPSLWALIEIYRRLLGRIEHSNFNVLEKRIRVPTWEKLSILASAALR
jgi:15-cis-phytoene synthase